MKYTALILLVAFIVTPLVLVGCDSLTLDNSKVDKLRDRVTQLEEQITHWEAANTRLQNEKADALDRLAMAVVVIREQDRQIAELKEVL